MDVGEVERLLRDYRQNQELVRNIGANYYQIIYPVQIRHHDKMGISTREVGSQKFPSSGLHGSNEGYSSGGSFRPKSRVVSQIYFYRASGRTRGDNVRRGFPVREDKSYLSNMNVVCWR
ncbi:hypothetical protein QTP88_009576 [Uroleucon formosanum]